MTYLSRIRINPLRVESHRLLANPRAMHGAVAGGITSTPETERVLWRLDADNPHRPHLLVLTRSKPDWTHVVENAGWPDADGEHAAVRDYTPLLNQIATGRQFAFRLTASPVQNTHTPVKPTPAQAARLATEPQEKRPRGLRLGHRTAAAQLQWFLSRTERWGFNIPPSHTDSSAPGLIPDDTDTSQQATEPSTAWETNPVREVRITERRRHSFAKNGKGPRITLQTATFEGRLHITDAGAFTEHLLAGIGPSKAYGCGLLTLAPLPAGGR